MKPNTSKSDPYCRPVTSRYQPCETVKRAIRCPWVDGDLVAVCEIEGGFNGITWAIYTDKHGYPAS